MLAELLYTCFVDALGALSILDLHVTENWVITACVTCGIHTTMACVCCILDGLLII